MFPFDDNASRMFPAKHIFVSHLNIEHKKYLQVRKKIGSEVIFTL